MHQHGLHAVVFLCACYLLIALVAILVRSSGQFLSDQILDVVAWILTFFIFWFVPFGYFGRSRPLRVESVPEQAFKDLQLDLLAAKLLGLPVPRHPVWWRELAESWMTASLPKRVLLVTIAVFVFSAFLVAALAPEESGLADAGGVASVYSWIASWLALIWVRETRVLRFKSEVADRWEHVAPERMNEVELQLTEREAALKDEISRLEDLRTSLEEGNRGAIADSWERVRQLGPVAELFITEEFRGQLAAEGRRSVKRDVAFLFAGIAGGALADPLIKWFGKFL